MYLRTKPERPFEFPKKHLLALCKRHPACPQERAVALSWGGEAGPVPIRILRVLCCLILLLHQYETEYPVAKFAWEDPKEGTLRLYICRWGRKAECHDYDDDECACSSDKLRTRRSKRKCSTLFDFGRSLSEFVAVCNIQIGECEGSHADDVRSWTLIVGCNEGGRAGGPTSLVTGQARTWHKQPGAPSYTKSSHISRLFVSALFFIHYQPMD